uniref:WYL domain-containing protein n=1 Tax=Serratia marcescens TaxID=615 RepID=UPI001CA363FE
MRKRISEQGDSITFRYADNKGALTERTVINFTTFKYKGVKYISGYCLLRKANRTFKVSKVSVITEQKGTIRKERYQKDKPTSVNIPLPEKTEVKKPNGYFPRPATKNTSNIRPSSGMVSPHSTQPY